ncbi:MAG: glycoside hydrolase family protein [Merismopedia sp. SIO2A8]|nr:glycoside hydrolase family protein [Merismopedia sp. SIO2A8]
MLSLPFVTRMKPILGHWRSIPMVERVTPEPHILSSPLVMEGGDPYIRALMRTISAAEANYVNPYSIVYGGRRVQDLSRHPDRCYAIEAGPNVGLCTTAAGRYQFITPTWELVAKRYHPLQSPWWRHHPYSFEPQYQDKVVHDWLADETAWSQDIPSLLRQDRVGDVFKLLATTWTSLSSGIEENTVTPYLQQIYQEALAEELPQEQVELKPS